MFSAYLSLKRFRAHTHLVYLSCVHSLHMSHVTLAHFCFMLLCVHVSCYSFPVVVRKCPHLHYECLVLCEDRLWRMPLASPWDSLFLVNRRFHSAAKPPIQTAVSPEMVKPREKPRAFSNGDLRAKIGTQGACADVSVQQLETNYKTHEHTKA